MHQSKVFKSLFVLQKLVILLLLFMIVFLIFYASKRALDQSIAEKIQVQINNQENLLMETSSNNSNVLDSFNNSDWQVLRGKNTAYLLNAYYDARPILRHPVVRIIAYMNSTNPTDEIWCRMWFQRGAKSWVRYTRTQQYDILWSMLWYWIPKGEFVGQLITCPIPENESEVPFSVSLAARKFDQVTNNLRVQFLEPENGVKKDFLVCVKHLDFPYDDVSIRLVEFLETNFLFGVDKVVLYSHQEHQNIKKVVDWYLNQSKVDYIPISVPTGVPNEPSLRHLWLKEHWMTNIILEPLDYNDCFYRHMHQYNYIILLDIDEVFVPKRADSYRDMLDQVRKVNPWPTSVFYSINKIMVRNKNDLLVEPEVPKYLDFLQISTQALNYPETPKNNGKSFFNTSTILTLNNHAPYATIDNLMNSQIPDNLGQLNHYRKGCFVDSSMYKDNYEVLSDFSLWRFKDKLLAAMAPVIEALGLAEPITNF